jgi:phage N-6-adenine-methyltransferase
MNVHFSAKSDEWATPPAIFEGLDAEFHFTLDPAASIENAKCGKFYTRDQNGLKQPWYNERVFCNPPYRRYEIDLWLEKLSSGEADIVVALLPVRTNTKWFHEYVWRRAEIRFIRGKLKFNGYKWQAPFPSMVCIWRKDAMPREEAAD